MSLSITKIIIVVIVVGGLGFFVANNVGFFNNKKASSNDSLVGQEIPILGKNHVPEGTKVTNYNSNPPTSGDHWPQPAEWGVYGGKVHSIPPDEQIVHNLEHGGIWISVRDINNESWDKLEQIAKRYSQAVILTVRPQYDSTIALASWGRLLKLDKFDEDIIVKFIKSNVNKSPEPLASLEQSTISVGEPFPDFSLTEVDGRVITKESLTGKPVIVWFTTSWCVPCQVGARVVAPLDKELGDNTFNVLVIFVDPKEKDADLINWREQFANPDWMVAFDNELTNLAKRVNLKFLDSKFLLDKNGVIKNIDFQIADEKYLNIIRGVVKEN